MTRDKKCLCELEGAAKSGRSGCYSMGWGCGGGKFGDPLDRARMGLGKNVTIIPSDQKLEPSTR